MSMALIPTFAVVTCMSCGWEQRERQLSRRPLLGIKALPLILEDRVFRVMDSPQGQNGIAIRIRQQQS
jgi:hypothetical protein